MENILTPQEFINLQTEAQTDEKGFFSPEMVAIGLQEYAEHVNAELQKQLKEAKEMTVRFAEFADKAKYSSYWIVSKGEEEKEFFSLQDLYDFCVEKNILTSK